MILEAPSYSCLLYTSARLLRVGEGRGGGQPAGVTAHALDDGDLADVVDAGIAGHFHRAGRDILGSGGVAGAVVGACLLYTSRCV